MGDNFSRDAAISDPFETMLGFQLRRTSVAATAALAAELDPIGIRPSEASLLLLIGANPGVTQSEIARALRAQPANLVPLIERLTRANALDRAPARGRAVALSLSADGQALHARVREAFERHEARIARSLPAKRRAEMAAILRQICDDACCANRDTL